MSFGIPKPPLIPGDANTKTSRVSNIYQTGTTGPYTSWKIPVLVATTTNITLTGLPVIDGVLIVSGDRVLVKNQTVATENGIYVVKSEEESVYTWSRANDLPKGSVSANMTVFVNKGSINGGSMFVCSNLVGLDIVGVNSLTFVLFESGGGGGGGGSTTPGGSDGTVQYNNQGSFEGSDLFKFAPELQPLHPIFGDMQALGKLTLGSPTNTEDYTTLFVISGADTDGSDSKKTGASLLITGGNSTTDTEEVKGGSVLMCGGNSTTFDGGDVQIVAGTGNNGGTMMLRGGYGTGVGSNGGNMYIGGADGENSGGNINLRAGRGESIGGDIIIEAGDGDIGGNILIEAGSASYSGSTGGDVTIISSGVVTITGGENNTEAIRGEIIITSGGSYDGSLLVLKGGEGKENIGGNVDVTAGKGYLNGGDVNITGGVGSKNEGGNVFISGGLGGGFDDSTTTGGFVYINGGEGHIGGNVIINAGDGLYQSAGLVAITAGSAQQSNGGSISITGGRGNNMGGHVSIVSGQANNNVGGDGDSGSIEIYASDGVVGTSGSGGDLVLASGRKNGVGTGRDGDVVIVSFGEGRIKLSTNDIDTTYFAGGVSFKKGTYTLANLSTNPSALATTTRQGTISITNPTMAAGTSVTIVVSNPHVLTADLVHTSVPLFDVTGGGVPVVIGGSAVSETEFRLTIFNVGSTSFSANPMTISYMLT